MRRSVAHKTGRVKKIGYAHNARLWGVESARRAHITPEQGTRLVLGAVGRGSRGLLVLEVRGGGRFLVHAAGVLSQDLLRVRSCAVCVCGVCVCVCVCVQRVPNRRRRRSGGGCQRGP